MVVKGTHLASTTSAFQGTNVNIKSEGKPHLRAPLGTAANATLVIYSNEGCKVVPSTQTLCKIASTQPYTIYAAFTHAVVHQWTYLARIVPIISTHFTPIEDIIRLNQIPSLTGRAPLGDLEWLLLSLYMANRMPQLSELMPCCFDYERVLYNISLFRSKVMEKAKIWLARHTAGYVLHALKKKLLRLRQLTV